MESDTSPPHRVEYVWFRIVYYNGNWDGWRFRALEDHFQFFLIYFTLAEPYPGLIFPRNNCNPAWCLIRGAVST